MNSAIITSKSFNVNGHLAGPALGCLVTDLAVQKYIALRLRGCFGWRFMHVHSVGALPGILHVSLRFFFVLQGYSVKRLCERKTRLDLVGVNVSLKKSRSS